MLPAMSPTAGSRRPRAAISTTATTKADETGLESLMPSEMPFTMAITNTRPTANARKNTGCPSMLAPSHTTATAQNSTQASRRPKCVRFQGSSSVRGTALGSRQRASASSSTRPMSSRAAPMMRPRPMRKVILRNGSFSPSQPMRTNHGISAVAVSPATMAGMPMRAPTSMPAPSVEVESSIAPTAATLAAARPPPRPRPMPLARRETERRSSTGSVRARKMLATARPEGKVSCRRSTRIGV